MPEVILICGVAAVCVCGYFIMRRLDAFWETNRQRSNDVSRQRELHLAFEAPLTAESISPLLETFSKQNPDISFYLFGGSADAINDKLKSGELDFAFLVNGRSEDSAYASVSVWLQPHALLSEAVQLPVEPLEKKTIPVCVVWKDRKTNNCQQDFVQWLVPFSHQETL